MTRNLSGSILEMGSPSVRSIAMVEDTHRAKSDIQNIWEIGEDSA